MEISHILHMQGALGYAMNSKSFFLSLLCNCILFPLYHPFDTISLQKMASSNMLNMPDTQDFGSFNSVAPLSRNTNSTPTTLFNDQLLSPVSLSFGARTTPGTLSGLEGHETHAYTQLWHQYQQHEQEYLRLKEEHEALRYVSSTLPFLDGCSHCFRNAHQKLAESHNMLMCTYIESIKTTCTPLPDPSSHPMLQAANTTTTTAILTECAWSEYPNIHFWMKKDWTDFENKANNSSDLRCQKGVQGGTRSANGENVMMLYIEHPNGESIDGMIASSIRAFARSIWRGFYE